MGGKCQFKSDYDPDYVCQEEALDSSAEGHCIFHERKKDKDIKKFEEGIEDRFKFNYFDFHGYYFPQYASFLNKHFTKRADFRGVTFEEGVGFVYSIFERNVDFTGATFKGQAYFNWASFKAVTIFDKAIFDSAYFISSIFESEVWFQHVSFKNRASFEGSVFRGLVQFQESTFRYKEDGEIPYREAKLSHRNAGKYDLAGEYYYLEKRAIRNRKKLFWRALECLFLDLTCGYGERPVRVIGWALTIIFGLATFYKAIGHITPATGLFSNSHSLTFWDCLYFSVVTFTTLGFGDWRPDPSHWVRYIVMTEAFVGAFLMALFVLTFGRKWMR